MAELVSSQDNDLVIVCAGTAGKFSLDDALCAGMLISLINEPQKNRNRRFRADGTSVFGADIGNINDKLTQCTHVKTLQKKGFQDDINYCLQAGIIPIVPVLKDNMLVKS